MKEGIYWKFTKASKLRPDGACFVNLKTVHGPKKGCKVVAPPQIAHKHTYSDPWKLSSNKEAIK